MYAGSANQRHVVKLVGNGVKWGNRGRAGAGPRESTAAVAMAFRFDGWEVPDPGRRAGDLGPGPLLWLWEMDPRPSLACVCPPKDSVSR